MWMSSAPLSFHHQNLLIYYITMQGQDSRKISVLITLFLEQHLRRLVWNRNTLTVTSMCRSSSSSGTLYIPYCSMKHCAFLRYVSMVSLDHHCARLPYLSLIRPTNTKLDSCNKIFQNTTWKEKYQSTDKTIIGKESGNSYWRNEEIWWTAHINTWRLNWNVLTIPDVFLDLKRVNVCLPFIRRFLHFFGKSLLFLFLFFFCL